MLVIKSIKPSNSSNLLSYCGRFRRAFQNSAKRQKSSHNLSPGKEAGELDTSKLRSIGIVAHINAGKTTTTERILYHAGSTDTVGDVDRGNTVTDYLVQERDRGITITSAAVSFIWNNHNVNLIDTPGHIDFTIEVERSLSVLDGAITIIDSSAGVEAQTVTVWNQASKYKLPNVIFLNKCDKPQADYRMCMKDLRTQLNINALLVQLPVNLDRGISSILDVIQRQHISWTEPESDNGSSFEVTNLIDSNLDKRYFDSVEKEREKLVNALTDVDDEFANDVLLCDKISQVPSESIVSALRRATIKSQLSPVLVGSSFKYIGVQQLMNAIIAYLPSPKDREKQIRASLSMEGEPKKSKVNCAFIFKIMHDKRLGSLSYIKVCNGTISKSQRLLNRDNNGSELIKRVYRVFADELKEVDKPVSKGDIVVVTGLSNSKTGDVLIDQNYQADWSSPDNLESQKETERMPFEVIDKSIMVPKIARIEPVYFCSIESRAASQQLKLESALACLAREDPSFTFDINEAGITTVRGMGKLHLEILRDRIQSEHKVEALLGQLQIAYRETISGSANEELSVNRLINGVKSVLDIKLYVRSLPKAGTWTGKMLRLDTSGDNSLGKLRGDHRKAIEVGFKSALLHGPSMGFPVIDCDILLQDFTANSRCSAPAISSAASQCLMNALSRCSPILLEPVMLLEVVTPSKYNGLILADITNRRGVILSTFARLNGFMVIKSHTPLATLANYSEFLRINTSGNAYFSMELHSYSAMSETDKQNIVRF